MFAARPVRPPASAEFFGLKLIWHMRPAQESRPILPATAFAHPADSGSLLEPILVGRRKRVAMAGERGQGARRPHGGPCNGEARRKHGKPCYDEQGSTRLPDALAATSAYKNRLLDCYLTVSPPKTAHCFGKPQQRADPAPISIYVRPGAFRIASVYISDLPGFR
jgi:hypothetical protein